MSDVITVGSKEVGESQEQKQEQMQELARKYAEQVVKKRFRSPFLQVYKEVTENGKTVEEVIQEVENKTSKISRIAREFVTNFQTARIKEWIEEEGK